MVAFMVDVVVRSTLWVGSILASLLQVIAAITVLECILYNYEHTHTYTHARTHAFPLADEETADGLAILVAVFTILLVVLAFLVFLAGVVAEEARGTGEQGR